MVDHDPATTTPSQMEDKGVPLWQKLIGAVFIIGWGAVVFFFHSRFSADFWPPDNARVAPNLVASLIIFSLGLIAGAVLWPPTRKAMHRFMDRKLAPVHEHLAVLRKHHEEAAEHRNQMDAKLDQLHAHLGIGAYAKAAPVKKTSAKKKG